MIFQSHPFSLRLGLEDRRRDKAKAPRRQMHFIMQEFLGESGDVSVVFLQKMGRFDLMDFRLDDGLVFRSRPIGSSFFLDEHPLTVTWNMVF